MSSNDLFDSIKRKISNIQHTINLSLWHQRLLLYFGFYIVILCFSLIFNYFIPIHTNVDSARYMLSALIQSEAAILAIVFTLSLVSVQLAAQSYSPRVIDTFKNSPDLQIIVSIYIGAIIYGLSLLRLLKGANQLNNSANFENHVLSAYTLGIFVFIALIPYIWNTLNLLKISTIFDNLSEAITKDNIISAVKEENKQNYGNDPIQPIIDILLVSIMRYDYDTLRIGLDNIEKRLNNIFQTHITDEEEQKISNHIFTKIARIGKLTAIRDDEDSTLEILNNLAKIGATTIRNKQKSATKNVFSSLEIVGKAAAIQKLEDATCKSIIYFFNLGRGAVEQDNKTASNFSIIHLQKMGKIAAKQNLIAQTNFSVQYLGDIGMLTIKHEDEKTTKNAVYSLYEVGKVTVEQKLRFPTIMTLISLGKIGMSAVDQKLEVINNVNDSLGNVGVLATEQEIKNASNVSINILETLGEALADKENEISAIKALESLKDIGKAAAKQSLEDVALKTINALEKIGKIAAQKHLELTATNTIDALKVVGIAVAEQKFDKTANEASKALFEVGKVATEQEFEDDVVAQRIKEAFEDFIRILEDLKLDWVKTNAESYYSDFIRRL